MSDQRDLAKALEALSTGRVDAATNPASSSRPSTPLDCQPPAPVMVPVSSPPPRAPAKLPSTLWPVSATLALTLPLLGAGWFLLDPGRVIRSIPTYVPLVMIAAGFGCAVACVVLWRGLTRSGSTT